LFRTRWFVSKSDRQNFALYAVRSLANCIRLWLTECDESSTLANSSSNRRHELIQISPGRPGEHALFSLCVSSVCNLQISQSRAPTYFPSSIRLMPIVLPNRTLGKRAIQCPRTAETVTPTLYEPYAFVRTPPPPRTTGPSAVGARCLRPRHFSTQRASVPAPPASARTLGMNGHATRRRVGTPPPGPGASHHVLLARKSTRAFCTFVVRCGAVCDAICNRRPCARARQVQGAAPLASGGRPRFPGA
jgi:hypothetical protein